MSILSQRALRAIAGQCRKGYAVRPRLITEDGIVPPGQPHSPVDDLPVIRQARIHALREGVRWGEPYVFFLAPGIISWIVPLVRGYEVRGGLVGGEVVAEDESEDRAEGVRHLVESGCARDEADAYVQALAAWPQSRTQKAADLLYTVAYEVTGWKPSLLEEQRDRGRQQQQIAEAIHRGKERTRRVSRAADERLLLSLIRTGDRRGARRRLNEILGGVFLRSANLAVVRALMIEMMGYLVRAAVEDSPHLEPLLEKNHRWMARVIEAPDFETLAVVLRDALDDFMQNIYRSGYQPTHAGVRAALDHLSTHYRGPVRLDEVAGAAGLSTFRLAHLFREHTGTSVIQHVHSLRVREAQHLLETTTKSCADIGYDVGFGDQSDFARRFRLFTGLTPARYRRTRGPADSSARGASPGRARVGLGRTTPTPPVGPGTRGHLVLSALLLASTALAASPQAGPANSHPSLQVFVNAASQDEQKAKVAFAVLAESWRDGYAALFFDFARFMRPRRESRVEGGARAPSGRGFGPETSGSGSLPEVGAAPPAHPTTKVRERLLGFLEQQTGQHFGDDLRAWRRWSWGRPYDPHPDYAAFKAALYSNVDERMGQFFPVGAEERIRLDEIDWGGVPVNGIPPLDHPKHIPAEQADYLKDKHVVFGLEVNGEARAYPKRILAWHELALDRLGGVELTVVYCTLCGTVIPYGSEAGGTHYTFGTSGLLYRSNKLLFDQETMSLWSTIEGRPVIGSLAARHDELELEAYPVVTTRWRAWKTLHPETTVLSLDTGYDRDYSEGAAYRSYFRTDELLFDVPKLDKRLKNKEPVLALLLRPVGDDEADEPLALAVSAKFLKNKRNRVYHKRFAGRELVIVTSDDGANRVYDAGETRFVSQKKDGRLRDATGASWRLTEAALVPEAGDVVPRHRLPARRVFWFAWQAQFPDTELVK